MGEASVALLKLKPVRFKYREADEHGQRPQQYGLIADEVAEVIPELVIYSDHGQPETVACQTLSSLLLNEFQKAQARHAQDAAKLAGLTRVADAQAQELVALRRETAHRAQQYTTLAARLEQLQKVTAQLAAIGVADIAP